MGSDKPPKYERISEDGEPGMYRLVRDLVAEFHTDIAEAKIALCWINSVKPDRDGHLLWGRAKKIGELEKEFHEHDFVIILNKQVWRTLPEKGKRALVDHELSHCGVECDEKTGEPRYHTKKHDVEDFVGVVRRHGLWKSDLEQFVNAALKREQMPLLDGVEHAPPSVAEAIGDLKASIGEGNSVTLSMPGHEPVTLEGKGKKRARG